MSARTLFDRIWQSHVVVPETPETPAILYVDLHLVHEVTSPQAFDALRTRGLPVRRPDLTLATLDHSTPTRTEQVFGGVPIADSDAAGLIAALERNCREHGIELHGLASASRGIVHVIGPELGATQPGMTIVCGDSHTSTHGAFGALAFGIGTSEVAQVLATQCLLQRRPRTLAVDVSGPLGTGVTAKDLILAIVARLGVRGGAGHVIEYRGPAIEALPMEARMTVCNMSIEAGARAGMIAPDETTFEYMKGRPRAPRGADWERALERWRALCSDADAGYDRRIDIDAGVLAPMITFGTNPGMAMPIDARIPAPAGEGTAFAEALEYMGVEPGSTLLDHPIDVVFVGSCTNARISDLRLAASIVRGRRVAPGVRMLVVPGSQAVKRQAEVEGLDRVFRDAGAEWRESGCSMCIAMNEDRVPPGQYAVSTSNRNFEGRQGQGARTFLASPLTAAAAAVRGRICDPRELLP